MGYELQAFIGDAEELRRWKADMPATVVCHLAGDLAMVPMTSAWQRDLLAHAGTTDLIAAVHAWAESVSRRALIAHVSGFEFGDQGTDDYLVWADGALVLATMHESKVAALFRERAGLDARGSFDIGRHRSESAAERWAARALPADQLAAPP